jgi:hypothetical protein
VVLSGPLVFANLEPRTWDGVRQIALFSSGNTPEPESRNFSVGLTLHSHYGAAAVIFTNPDGSLETYTKVAYGSKEYRETMARLSLNSSRHLA